MGGGVLGRALSAPRLGVGAGQSASGLASTSFASLANSTPAEQKDQKVKTDTKIINNTAKPADKSSDINSLKKKLAMMERETSRLREMHKLRLKKLETKHCQKRPLITIGIILPACCIVISDKMKKTLGR